jgi:hypothetical protein
VHKCEEEVESHKKGWQRWSELVHEKAEVEECLGGRTVSCWLWTSEQRWLWSLCRYQPVPATVPVPAWTCHCANALDCFNTSSGW